MAFGLIAGALGVAGSLFSGRKASNRDKRATKLAQQRATIQNVKNRRAAMAAARRTQAQRTVAAVATGMAGGSADRATRSSVASQETAGIAMQDHMIELGAGITANQTAANRYRNQASTIGALGSLGMQLGQHMASSSPVEPAQPVATAPSLPVGYNTVLRNN